MRFENYRLIAHLRSQFPIIYYLSGLIVGQLLIFILFSSWRAYSSYLCLIGIISSLLFFKGNVAWYRLCPVLPISLGMITALMALPLGEYRPQSSRGYLVEVIDSPRHRSPGGVEISLAILGEIKEEGGLRRVRSAKLVCRAIDLPWRNIAKAREGARFIFRGRISPIDPKKIEPISYEAGLYRKGVSATCKIGWVSKMLQENPSLLVRIRDRLRRDIESVLGVGERSGLFLSMSIGTRDVLSEPTERAFKRLGLAHPLVVSGYQVTLVYYAVFTVLRWIAVRMRWLVLSVRVSVWCAIVGLLLSLIFVLFVGVDGASLRAGLAVIFVAFSSVLERGGGMVNAIFVSLLLISIIWPGAYLDPGVQLSYAALSGIAIGDRVCQSSWGKFFAICLFASLFLS